MDTSRRDLLRGAPAAALGVTSLALPSATAAASGDESPSVAAPELLLAWNYSNTVTQFGSVTSGSLGQTSTIDATVSGTFGFDGLLTQDTGQNKWRVDAPAASLDTATAPYLEWNLSTSGDGLDLQHLAVYGIAADSLSDFVASFRHSVDGYATDLRTLTPVGSSRNLLVDLSGLAVVTGTVTIRMFVHGSTGTEGLFTMSTRNAAPFQVGVDEYLAAQGGTAQCSAILGNLVP